MMQTTNAGHTRRVGPDLRSDRGGFIVLGCLGAVVLVLTLMVLVGKLTTPPERYHVVGGPRELRYATRATEVRFGASVTDRLEAGEPVWGETLPDGRVAVYRDRRALEMLGFVPAERLSREPLPETAAYGSTPRSGLRSRLSPRRWRRG